MKPLFITDHALLRWLDRVERIGVEALRMRFGPELADWRMVEIVERELGVCMMTKRIELGQSLVDAGAPEEGNFEWGNFSAKIKSGKVLTFVLPDNPVHGRRHERKISRLKKQDERRMKRTGAISKRGRPRMEEE